MLAANKDERSFRELERDAERNRAELVSTVDALQERLSPRAIKNDVQDYVRDKKDGLIASLEQRARDNPLQALAFAAGAAYPLWSLATRIPAPLLLIGAGFALARRSNGAVSQTGDSRGFVGKAREGLGRTTETAQQKLDDLSAGIQQQLREGLSTARGAGERLAEVTSEVSQRTQDVTSSVGERLSQAAEAGSRVLSGASDRIPANGPGHAVREVRSWADDALRRDPLILGLIGLAVGATIAAAVPATRQENRFLGPASDKIKKAGQDAALQGVETVKGVAQDVYRDAARQAREQRLSADGLKDAAVEIGDKIKSSVAKATGQPGQREQFGEEDDGDALALGEIQSDHQDRRATS